MRKQSSRFKFVRPWESDLKYDPSRRFTIPPLKIPPQINDFDSPQYDFEIYQPYDGPNYVNPNPYERYEPQNFLNDPYEKPPQRLPQFQPPQNGPIYPIPQFDSFEFMPYEDSLAGQWDRCTKEMEEENDRLEWEEQFRQAEIRNKQRRRLERIRKKHPAVPPIDNDWGVQPSYRIDRLMN